MAESQSTVCLKHSPNWNKRLYWVLNKLYDTLIPKKYQKRVGGLLCTCERRENLPPRGKLINPLPDNKILDWFKWEQIADDI